MPRPFMLLAIVLTLLSMGSDSAWAQRGGRGGHPGGGAVPRGGEREALDRGREREAFDRGREREAFDRGRENFREPINEFNIQNNRTFNNNATYQRNNVGAWGQNFNGAVVRPQPFTPGWYYNHPNAWYATHPHADVFVAATAIGLANWLAVPVVPVYDYSDTAGYVSEPLPAVNNDPGTMYTGAAPVATNAPPPAPAPASDTAPAAADAAPQWMPLGVFALKSSSDDAASRTIFLAVSPAGELRGTSTDAISDSTDDVRGSVDKKAMLATWRIGERGQTTFQARLGDLTLPECDVTVTLSSGQKATWRLVRQTKPAS